MAERVCVCGVCVCFSPPALPLITRALKSLGRLELTYYNGGVFFLPTSKRRPRVAYFSKPASWPSLCKWLFKANRLAR